MTDTFRMRVDAICAPFPGAHWAAHDDGGLDAWKVGDKMFACLGIKRDGVSVKTQDIETAAMLIEAGIGIKAPYFHKSWIRLLPDCANDELEHRLIASYDLVRSSLPKKIRDSLPPREQT